MKFSKLLNLKKENKAVGELDRELTPMLAGYEEKTQAILTGFAGLLGSVAYSDRDFSIEETEKLKEILREHTSFPYIDTEEISDIIKLLAEKTAGIEDYQYIRLINNNADNDTKKKIMTCLFLMAGADNSISVEEENRLAILANDLSLTKSDYTGIKEKFASCLAVLK